MLLNRFGAVVSIAAILIVACKGAAPVTLAHAVIDTLPGGIPRVTSSGPTAWTDSTGARLVEVSRFSGDEGTPSELGNPSGIAVDDLGRVYVVEQKPALIKVYSPDGTLVRTIGREGDGPGEFRVGFIAVRDGYLALHDPQQARTSLWDTAGTFLRSWHSSCCYWSTIQIDRQHRIYVPSMVPIKPGEKSRGTAYARWSLEGVALDTVWTPRPESEKLWTVSQKQGGKEVSMMNTSIPFMPEQVQSLHPDGGVVHAWTGAYSIVRSITGADSVRVFGRSWTPEPVSDSRKREELESRVKGSKEQFGESALRAAFKFSDIPSIYPAFETIRVDETGRIWAQRYAGSDTLRTAYDIFDSTGAYLGPVAAPIRVNGWSGTAWLKDGMVTVTEGPDGRPAVARLKLEMTTRPR